MKITSSDIGKINNGEFAPGAAPVIGRNLTTQSAGGSPEERNRVYPIWIRAPKSGPEHFTGFTRAKLYELEGRGLIRSVSIREPGRIKGVRLFELQSILDYIERCERRANLGKEVAK